MFIDKFGSSGISDLEDDIINPVSAGAEPCELIRVLHALFI